MVVFLEFGFFASGCGLALCADTIFDYAEERHLTRTCLTFWVRNLGGRLGGARKEVGNTFFSMICDLRVLESSVNAMPCSKSVNA